MTWSTDVGDDPSVFDELGPWWDDQRTAREIPFLRSAFLREVWADDSIEMGSRLHVALLLADGDVVAAVPGFRRGRLVRSFAWDTLVPFDVVGGEAPEVVDRMPRWLEGESITRYFGLRASSRLLEVAEASPRWRVFEDLEAPYIDLTEGVEAVWGRMGTKTRGDLRRKRRRLEESGEVVVERERDVGRLLDEGLELEAAGWKGAEGVAALNDAARERWYRSVARAAAGLGWLRLTGIRVDGRLAGFAFDLEADGRRHLVLTAHLEDPAVSRFSPGMQVMAESIADAVGEGSATYELGEGTVHWKKRWTDASREYRSVVVYGRDLRGRYARLRSRAAARSRPASR